MNFIYKAAVLLVIPMFLGSADLIGQNVKIGHINSNDLLELMPERGKATKEVKEFTKKLEKQVKVVDSNLSIDKVQKQLRKFIWESI